MKRFLKPLFLLLAFVLLLGMMSCAMQPQDDINPEQGSTDTIDRTDPSAGTYKIHFKLAGNTVTHYYNAGETIIPPETLPAYETSRSYYIFDGWDGVEFAIVDGNATYTANHREEFKYYTVTFLVGDERREVKTICGDMPKAPAISEFSLSDGERFVTWDTELSIFNEDITIMGVTTKYFDPEYFLEAYNLELLAYPSVTTMRDNETNTLEEALALNCLLIEENQNPKGGSVAERIVAHLTSVVSKDNAPLFDARCYWSYAPNAGAIAIAKATPTVWEKVPQDIKGRLDTMMRAFAMLESFATSDFNNYSTGPSMGGNYHRDWNPNYRLANVPVILYAVHYFGNGDMEAGAEYVNDFLKGFDENAYTAMVNSFQKYGWRRAFITWTSEGVTTSDGSLKGNSAKELLLIGGPAVGEDTPLDSDLKVPLGNGFGVANNGQDYLYKGYRLTEADGIIRSLLMYNYGTGDLEKTNETRSTFLEVKSDHWYDTDKDGVKECIAWIADESESPYQGRYGMMKEFASGDRSSASYCSHDFLLTTSLLYTCKVLGIYDIITDTYVDRNGISIREAVIVGNEDFLYKNEIGYQGYSSGSYGTSIHMHSEQDEYKESYFVLKSLWRGIMLPELEATLAE